jgi:putative DNA primase/helicase
MPVADDEFPYDDPRWVQDYGAPDNVVALPGALPTEVSEDSIALAFTREHGTTMRFDHDAGRWYQWSTTHWRSLTVPAAFHFAREIGRRMASGKKQMCKASVAGGAERFARADPIHAVTSEIWDNDPWLMGTPNGTLNLQNGKMHAPRPAEGITKLTGCAPERKEPELWMKFLRDATRGDEGMITYLQRVAGYCLTGLTIEHALFFIYGPGGNGKSVFLNTLVHILGDYAISAPMDTFTSSKFSSHPTELAMLKGARLVTASETEEGRSWAEARIKALTGGDPISARFMRQDFFTYQPHFKLLFAGNHQPTLNAVDPAMRRRFNMLPFINKPTEPDHMLEEKLRAEAPRILAWALQGCIDWQREGLARPETVTEATDEYFEDQDVFGAWLADRCTIGRGESEVAAKLFRSWSNFSREQGDTPGTSVTFAAKLRKQGFAKKRTMYGALYQGLSLKQREKSDDEHDGYDGI